MKDNGNVQKKQQQQQRQEEYNQWLKTNQVYHASHLVKTTQQNVVAGWGCVAKCDIKGGTVLFSIPKSACFTCPLNADEVDGSDSDDNDSDDGDGSSDSDEDETSDPTTSDTQKEMALHLLRCQQSNDRQKQQDNRHHWAPFLNMLTPHPLPWTWPKSFRSRVLKGTELEHVVENKIQRIRQEYQEVVAKGGDEHGLKDLSYTEYLNATALVASHANPWFGVSIVPFNTTLNWGRLPHVEFDLDHNNNEHEEEVIVGRSTCDIKKGQELFQRYGDSIAELVYRCGFAPRVGHAVVAEAGGCDHDDGCDGVMEGDTVSIALSDLVEIAQNCFKKKQQQEEEDGLNHSVNSEKCTPQQQQKQGLEGTVNSSNNAMITNLSLKIQALKQSGAIDDSPWDGMEELTVEFTRPSKQFLSRLGQEQVQVDKVLEDSENSDVDGSVYDDGGVSKLIGVFVVLLADNEAWKRAAAALENIDSADNTNGPSTKLNHANNEGAAPPSKTDSEGEDDDESKASEDESRTDDITASILLSSLANLSSSQSMQMKQLALAVGMDDNDPWRALLLELVHMDAQNLSSERGGNKKRKLQKETTPSSNHAVYKKPSIQWELALEAARVAIRKRLQKSIDGDKECKALLKSFDAKPQVSASKDTANSQSSSDGEYMEEKLSDCQRIEAIEMIQILRRAERAILDKTMDILKLANTWS